MVNLNKPQSRSHFAKEEDAEKLREDSFSRWKEAEAGKVVEHDKVIQWLDGWGTEEEKDRS